MKETLKDAIHQQRLTLAELLSAPLADLSEKCAAVWGQREQLDIVLSDGFRNVPHCLFLYVLDTNGIQISDNVSSSGLLPEHYGRDRSRRPYMRETVPSWGFLLSDAYLSLRANRPSLTALQVVRSGNEMLGFLGADFDLRDLPVTAALYEESSDWRQVKGDPAIRGTVFQQCRVDSLMDRNMDPAMAILEELLTERGMFQGVIHFSSSRATIWLMDDPFRYRILDHEALSDPDVCMLYSRRSYPEDALIPPDRIKPLLNGMRQLRLADETLYLRSASINIFNGMISLTFSCDGTHYMSWREFLDKDISFWVGCAA
ncbi:MAG: PDC sensor domain-containing protein [Gammaproteobacteria bacterium]|nr:PDC sensor domain-containing protein [Gammaproteobacteria bacterium]